MDFEILADSFEKLEATRSRLEMTDILAELFKKVKANEIEQLVFLLQGRVAPVSEATEVGLGEKLIEQALATAAGYGREEIEKLFKEKGDLGDVAQELMKKKKQRALFSKSLSIQHVFDVFYKIAKLSGAGSQDLKIKLLAELLNSASPTEAKYLVRIPLSQLRLGIGDPTILDAFSMKEKGTKELREKLERAYNLCSNLGLVAKVLCEKGIAGVEKFRIIIGNPIRPALAERLPTAKEIIDKLGTCAADAKYDGFRLAIHISGGKVWLFSRRSEDMTHMFPELVAAAKMLKVKEAIFDGEALSYNEETQEYLPFQATIQRKRKYDVAEMSKAFPLKLFAFDLLYLNGKDYMNEPYLKRRKVLEKIIGGDGTIRLSETMMVKNEKELQKFFNSCVSRGLEGVICKDLNAPYVAGARKFAWVKLKRSYRSELSDTIDVVIIGYNRGRGARAQFGLGAVLTAVYDDKSDLFQTIAKVGSGITEKGMAELKKMLDAIKLKHKPARLDSIMEADVWVEPKYVVTINADEITQSPIHTCGRKNELGYALRFPRIVGQIRRDKKPEEATSVKEILNMYESQKRISLEDSAIH